MKKRKKQDYKRDKNCEIQKSRPTNNYLSKFLRSNWIVMVVLGAIGLAVFAGIVGTCSSEMKIEHWIALCTGELGYIGTALLGVVTVYQNHKYKLMSDQKDELIKSENEKARINEMKIKANPFALFAGISNVDLQKYPTIVGYTSTHNTLSIQPIAGIASFDEMLSFDLVFELPPGNVVDCVELLYVWMRGTIGNDPHDKNYEVYSQMFHNNQATEHHTNVTYNTANKFSTIVMLLNKKTNDSFVDDDSVDVDDKDNWLDIDDPSPRLAELLDNSNVNWSLEIAYSTRNSLGIICDMETKIWFNLKNVEIDTDENAEAYSFYEIVNLEKYSRLTKSAHHESEEI